MRPRNLEQEFRKEATSHVALIKLLYSNMLWVTLALCLESFSDLDSGSEFTLLLSNWWGLLHSDASSGAVVLALFSATEYCPTKHGLLHLPSPPQVGG
jgi:hypothetical protein